jgi:hypothetical protein
MMILAIGIEHALDAAIERPHDADVRKHCWTTARRHQDQGLHGGLPFGRRVFGLGELGDIVARVAEGDELAPAGQRDRLVERSLPAENGEGRPGDQLRESCNRASRRLVGIPRERVAGDGRPSFSS